MTTKVEQSAHAALEGSTERLMFTLWTQVCIRRQEILHFETLNIRRRTLLSTYV
jgi:hypothetical protein